MFDKLLEILKEIWGDLTPIAVLHQYNGGVQMRMGKLLRVLEGGGWYWKVPFADHIIFESVVPRTERLTGLATTTADGKAIGFDAVVTWRISDIQKSLLEVNDLKDAIADTCAGIIGSELSNSVWEDILHGNTVESLTAACRKRGWRWGVEIQQVQLTGVAPVRNLRVSMSGMNAHYYSG
jgi:regulator of protease activity HflC (stomatin/prohibitin superfamily)